MHIKIFLSTVGQFYLMCNNFFNYLLIVFKPLWFTWNFYQIEWFIIQVISTFLLYRLFYTTNHYKQLMLLILILLIICICISILQLELFAAFLFLAEFAVIIFFYTLLLHLRSALWQRVDTNQSNLFILIIVSVLIIFSINFTHINIILIAPYLLFINVYKYLTMIFSTDLLFFWVYFVKYYLFIHLIVGLILFFLTLFLFSLINLYFSMNLKRQNYFQTSEQKLYTQKGYFEQTALIVQKIITNKK